MIELRDLSKHFPGAARAAVDRLTLSIAEGDVCVLIGPSGCGKTTTMRMIIRMIEPDGGTITVGGRNVLEIDPIDLRRSIGYVIQQVGLFPHWSIADNIATVPRLLGWDENKIRARIDELLTLVGMAFVEEFVGADRALKRLALITAAAVQRTNGELPLDTIAAEASLRDALALMLAKGVDALTVTGPGTARPSGVVTLARIREYVRVIS